jgi:hypothetical protein
MESLRLMQNGVSDQVWVVRRVEAVEVEAMELVEMMHSMSFVELQ